METHIMQSVNAATDPINGREISYDLFMPYCCVFIGKFVDLLAGIQSRVGTQLNTVCLAIMTSYGHWKRIFRVYIH